MGSLTIRNIDDDLKRKLKLRAARNGHSMEEDLRQALQSLVEKPAGVRSEAEARIVYARLRALAFPPALDPFDQKTFSDELNDFVP